ncbi:N-6 DNA methylase [Actinomarinicola tropica]|uniref:site-specific DNA-methyltransferase (adenine-specific) n=1 Tax=Actinomarinicola tropica TaxID=2789776 RepID=A0A5Q2RH42_9ACTN|nr:N-6 DNA methylase [Actinomarinicola tropica]QGG95063.1 N-6 DNA methylase [Actinomarinicola tropica]
MVDRAARGAVFTPEPIGRALVAAALSGRPRPPRSVADPAAGDGRLLAAARRALDDVELYAADVDGAAWRRGPGGSLGSARFLETDVLVAPAPLWSDLPAGADLVIGNPPFLDQLDARSALDAAAREGLRRRYGDVVAGYTDLASLFLVAACEMAAEDGRVALIMPASFLSARDAEPARRRVLELGTLDGIWWGGDGIFEDADVQVCALVLDRSGPRRRHVRRWVGPRWHPVDPLDVDGDALRLAPSWGPLVAGLIDEDLPQVALASDAVLGDVAAVGAGFRDQFYGLAPLVTDIGGDPSGRTDGRAPLVTSGLVDPGRVGWGRRPARIAGRTWTTPGIDPADLPDGRLARWVAAQRRPKVVVASQTPVVEPVADPTGEWVPSTPVLSVHPGTASLWRCLAVLLAPPVSAWARAHAAGSALTSRAIRVSAPLLRAVPLPPDERAWSRAATVLERSHRGDGSPPDAVVEAATTMTAAYGCDPEADVWWRSRAGRLSPP